MSHCWHLYHDCVVFIFSCYTKEENLMVLKVQVVLSSSPSPVVPHVLHYFFPPCPPFLFFLILLFEASPEDSVNGLTSQLLLKQCGVGPLLCSVCIEKRTRPPKVNRGPWHSGGHVRQHPISLHWYDKNHGDFYEYQIICNDITIAYGNVFAAGMQFQAFVTAQS